MVEKIVSKILSDLRESRDLVLAAQNLVNNQFNANATLLGFKVKNNSNQLKKFKETVKKSTFLSEKEKKLFWEDDKAYRLARETILQLTKREIKNPLAK